MPETLVTISSNDETILFQTEHAQLVQSDSREKFGLTIFGEQIEFRICELIAFKRKIEQIDLVRLLSDESPDIEIVHLIPCDKVFLLDVRLVLELKSLMAGAFAMLELNSIIHKCIVRRLV
jgi:hypothetical protein